MTESMSSLMTILDPAPLHYESVIGHLSLQTEDNERTRENWK
jgi:hypothetical protein